ncbi:MAG: DUF1572 family protein [Bacteroidota bacterium]
MKTDTLLLPSSLRIFKQYKKLADDAIKQIDESGLHWKPEPESNSIAIVMKHLSDNMLSRWSDFLTSDGEKEWRNRDTEFEEDQLSTKEIMAYWEKGWNCLFDALEPLTNDDLSKIVHIRGEAHSVMEAVNRQIAHYAYHVGQIVYLAKAIQSTQWQTLSIAKGQSKAFNDRMK